MSTTTKRFSYEPQQDVIEFTAPNFVLVKFGTITMTEADNTKETYWVKGCFEEMKQLATGAPLKVLIDMSSIDSGEYNSKESNNLYREMLQDPALEKVAVFGLPHGWQLLIDVLRAFVPHKLKTFTNEMEAKQWLTVPINVPN